MPPIQHDRGGRQRLALQPPQPGIAVAQHRRRRVGVHPGRGERLRERVGRDRLAVAGESEAGLAAIGVDHLARDHLEMALLLPVPAADVAAIKSNHHRPLAASRSASPSRWRAAHDGLAHPQRPVSDCARVLRPADRQQLRQQDRNLAERRQRRISRRDVGQFWCHRIMAEIEDAEALRLTGP